MNVGAAVVEVLKWVASLSSSVTDDESSMSEAWGGEKQVLLQG